jgi:hypothetical protein
VTQETAGAFHTILHEAIHRQGIKSERTTEAFAITTMRTAGQMVEFGQHRYYDGMTPDESEEAWYASEPAGDRAMRLAWQQSRDASRPRTRAHGPTSRTCPCRSRGPTSRRKAGLTLRPMPTPNSAARKVRSRSGSCGTPPLIGEDPEPHGFHHSYIHLGELA